MIKLLKVDQRKDRIGLSVTTVLLEIFCVHTRTMSGQTIEVTGSNVW